MTHHLAGGRCSHIKAGCSESGSGAFFSGLRVQVGSGPPIMRTMRCWHTGWLREFAAEARAEFRPVTVNSDLHECDLPGQV